MSDWLKCIFNLLDSFVLFSFDVFISISYFVFSLRKVVNLKGTKREIINQVFHVNVPLFIGVWSHLPSSRK